MNQNQTLSKPESAEQPSPEGLDETTCSEFPWYATNEKQECQIVKPRQVIMGNWLLMRNREGVEWFVPFPELRPNTPNAPCAPPRKSSG
jgi:hypothetical protein